MNKYLVEGKGPLGSFNLAVMADTEENALYRASLTGNHSQTKYTVIGIDYTELTPIYHESASKPFLVTITATKDTVVYSKVILVKAPYKHAAGVIAMISEADDYEYHTGTHLLLPMLGHIVVNKVEELGDIEAYVLSKCLPKAIEYTQKFYELPSLAGTPRGIISYYNLRGNFFEVSEERYRELLKAQFG